MKLCSWQLFYLNSFRFSKIESKYVKFKIQILQTTSDEKSVKIKVVELQKLFIFVVDNFFIWIRLGSQISNLHSNGCNMWRKQLQTRHKSCHRRSGSGGYARGWGLRFDSSQPRSARILREKCRAGGVVLIQINFFTIFRICFMFSETICTGGFITSTASENRFSLAVLLRRPSVKIDFHWRFLVTRL